jgi:calcineurin-like phosphoesterase
MLCAVVIEIDDEKQVSKKITRIQIRPNDWFIL